MSLNWQKNSGFFVFFCKKRFFWLDIMKCWCKLLIVVNYGEFLIKWWHVWKTVFLTVGTPVPVVLLCFCVIVRLSFPLWGNRVGYLIIIGTQTQDRRTDLGKGGWGYKTFFVRSAWAQVMCFIRLKPIFAKELH